jgi:transposase
MRLVDDPDEQFWYPPAACRECGKDLAAEPVTAQRRHQVTDIEPTPGPRVTEHVAQAKKCSCCGTVTEGELPAHVRARASFGPETCAQAANLTAGHHIPIWRSTLLLCELAGIAVSTGWMAGIRGKAAALVGASRFLERVRELLRAAPEGGAWRTIEGLADFAVTQSYLSTATKWEISKLDALRDPFNGHAWIPPGLEPSG